MGGWVVRGGGAQTKKGHGRGPRPVGNRIIEMYDGSDGVLGSPMNHLILHGIVSLSDRGPRESVGLDEVSPRLQVPVCDGGHERAMGVSHTAGRKGRVIATGRPWTGSTGREGAEGGWRVRGAYCMWIL